MTISISIIFLFLDNMVHKALGYLGGEDGRYSKARIAMLLMAIIFLGFFIWLIAISVTINDKEHSKNKGIYNNNFFN